MPTSDRPLLRGLVLREVDYRDSDRMLTILTAERGLVSAAARGARRKNSTSGAGTQLFVLSEFALFESRGRFTVDAAEPVELFLGLRSDIVRLALASYFAEVLCAVAPENTDASLLLGDTLNLLYALSRGLKSEALIKSAFELRVAAICGWQPWLDECENCGSDEPDEPVLTIAGGELKCKEHAREGYAPLDRASLAAMRYLLAAESKRMLAFELTDGSLERLSYATEAFLLDKLERGFSTLEFYKSVL